MDHRGSTMQDAPSILPVDFSVLDDDLPVPGDIEILGAHESRYLDDFFAHRGVNGHGVSPSEEGLGGVYTPNWLMPPSVVGHNVSYGYWDEGMVATMFGNEIQKLSPATAPSTYGLHSDPPAAAPFTFGYEAHHATTTPSSTLRRQPPSAGPSNLAMPDLMTPQSQQSLNIQHGYDHQPTDDVLAAASVLSHGNGAHFDMFYNQRQQNHAPISHPSTSHYQAATSSTAHANQNRPAVLDNMVYRTAPSGGQPYTRRPPPPVGEIQFGSDPNFNNEKFMSQSARDTTQAMVEKQLATLQCLERNDSAAPTRAASPSAWAPISPNTARRSSMISPVQLRTASQNPLTPDEPPNGEPGPPTKRRRSSKAVEDTRLGEPSQPTTSLPAAASEAQPPPPPKRISEYKRRKLPEALTPEAESATTAAATKKRKSPQTNTTATTDKTNGNTTAATTTGSGRRKSSQAKPPREPLNEDQKRENHIRSEQKRRGVISRGYDILYELVPVLREGRTHKANALQRAADFIECLAAGNEKLREMLAEAGVEGHREGHRHGSGHGSEGRGLT